MKASCQAGHAVECSPSLSNTGGAKLKLAGEGEEGGQAVKLD